MIFTLIMSSLALPAFAAGDVAGAIENMWNAAKTQIKGVVNNVIFPVIDLILAVLFLQRSQWRIWTIASTDNLSLVRHVSN